MPIQNQLRLLWRYENYMDFRDVVHATQSQMLKQFGGENVFQGRIIEVHLGTLTADLYFYRLDG
jgi:aconitate hydratase 2/2-methylisocitrate dehydratase